MERAALEEKLQLLRSITNSNAQTKTSIIEDACKYIQHLKHKVQTLNQDISSTAQSSAHHNPLPVATVQSLEMGFLIKLNWEKSCPGLLVFVLEAFKEQGLNVLEARVSCTDSFQFQAVAQEEQVETIDAQVVKQAMYQAIKNWSESTRQE